MTGILICPACGRALDPSGADRDVQCAGCSTTYPVHLGIVDLRAGRFTMADDRVLDAADDLRQAYELDRVLASMTHREWFFSRVDRDLAQIEHPQRRRVMQAYYERERHVYGIHGESVLAKLVAFLADREPERLQRWRMREGTALEAGCGTGQYEIGFAQQFRQVYVTDLSYVSLVHAKRIALDEGLGNVTLFASNVEALPIRSGSLEFIHSNGVIEHVADPERVVAESARVISDTGVAFFLSPNRWSLYIEPHVRVVAFHYWPPRLRRVLAQRFRGNPSFIGTRLRSLEELRSWGDRYFARRHVYMLPRRLGSTAQRGSLRKAIRALLSAPLVGGVVDLLINRLLLGVMPYHVMVAFKR